MKEKFFSVTGHLISSLFKSSAISKAEHDQVFNTIQVYTLKPKHEIEEFIRVNHIDENDLMRYVKRYCQFPDKEAVAAINHGGLGINAHFHTKGNI